MIDAFGIHIGPLYIRFYALILMTGMAAAVWLTARRAAKNGLDSKHIWDAFLMWAIVPGLIGARIYHILTPSPASGLTTQYYLDNPLQMLAIWNGGLGIYGAIVGGALGLLVYGLRHKQPILRWFDLIVPGVALAQAIGRWGNFINQELYGPPTSLPWGVVINGAHRVPPYTDLARYPVEITRFHPLFLYESLWNLGTCLGLLYIERRFRGRLRPGDIFLLYLMSYATIRFLLDFIRPDSFGFGPLTMAQAVSLGTFLVSGMILIIRRRHPVSSVVQARQ